MRRFDFINRILLFRNELEREYVQLLQFNVNVASSIYAKYYFDLRQIAKENQISLSDELLTREKAIKLEVCQSIKEHLIQNRYKLNLIVFLKALSIANNRLQHPYSDGLATNKPSNTNSNQQQSVKSLIPLRRSASVEFTQSARKSLLIIS